MHQRVVTEAARGALAGVEGEGEILGYRGIPTLASWGPLAIPGTKWALIAKIDTSEAFAPIDKLRNKLMVVGGLALLAMMLTGAWLSRALLGPLRELTAGVTRFAAGDYGAKVAVRTRDEIGRLCSAFNGMVDELRGKNVVIENKNRENEELLLNVLPAPIANRLRGGEQQHSRRLCRGHRGLRRHRRLHRHVVGHAACRRRHPAERPVQPLRRGGA